MMVVRSFIRKIHLWLSIPFGIFLIVSLLTGAVLEYKNIRNHSSDIYYSFSNMHFYLVYHENKCLSMLVY